MSNQYTEESIQKLDPLSFTRLRPDTYCGSTEDSTQLIKELITNCIDEHLIGNCNEVFITFEKNNVITVSDTGQGILPNVIKEDGKTILEMVYGDINTSGKYDKSEDAVYKVSTGAFGIGASLSNFLSHWLIATTKRDGKFETVYFKEGKFDKREVGVCSKEEHGVIVKLQPSEEFFKSAAPNKTDLKNMLNNISCICPNLIFHLDNEIIHHPDGIIDLIIQNKDVNILNNIFLMNEEIGRQELNLGFAYLPQSSSTITAFCNYGLIEAGTPITTIKSTITRTLNKWAKEQGLLKEKEKNLEGVILQEGLKLVFNLVSPNIRYDSQTKVRVTSTEDNPFISSTLGEQLEIWLDNNPTDGRIIIEKALVARRAAEAAKKARAAVKAKANAVPAKAQKAIDLPSKLADCFSKDRKSCEIYVVEGDSAGGNLKQVRNNEFQAVFPLRGKMLNTQKASLDKILKNAEIVNLIKAFGLQISSDGKKVVYDRNTIRYGKIIIMSDADVDGSHIKNLFYTFIWNFVPDLIVDGFVYAGVPPLYRLKNNKEVIYLKDNAALEKFKKNNNISKYQIARNKGLGEMSPEETEEALVNPETRIIEQITIDDTGKADILFDTLMGSSAEKRKKYIEEHSEEASVVI